MLVSRRVVLAAGLAAPTIARAQSSSVAGGAHAFSFEGIDGKPLDLKAFAGRPVLIVNTASQCGFTPQFADLQMLWTRYRARGLMIVGVPSNDFGGQEPGDAAEILHVSGQQYGVSFPLAAKQSVAGDGAHPFYRWAALQRPDDVPRWNFHKYLIGGNGQIASVFGTTTKPTDPRVQAVIEVELRAREG